MSSKKLNQIKIIKILVICTKALYYLTLYKDKEKYFLLCQFSGANGGDRTRDSVTHFLRLRLDLASL